MLPNSKKFSQNTAGFDMLPKSVFSMQNVKKRSSVCSRGTLHLPIFSSNGQNHTTGLLLARKQKSYVGCSQSAFFSACTFMINYTLKKNEDIVELGWFFTRKKIEIIAFF